MDKYVAPEMEIVEFETEDVIMTSTCIGDCPTYVDDGDVD